MNAISVLIGGDICLNSDLPEARLGHYVDGGISSIVDRSDFFLANLESPFCLEPSRIRKTGPTLSAPAHRSKVLSSVGLHAMGLANNHIRDQGDAGVMTTIDACRQLGILTIGAGRNKSDAAKINVFDVKGVRLAVIAVCENEFSVATDTRAGANPLDLIDLCGTLSQNSLFDRLVVLLHGGLEYYPYPTPDQQRLCRFLIDHGADAVVCQHSHCIGGHERYGDGVIVYGQGNFLFRRPRARSNEWNLGYLVRLTFQERQPPQLQCIPIRQHEAAPYARLCSRDEGIAILQEIEELSEVAADPLAVRNRWQTAASQRASNYFGILRGYGRILGYLNRRLGFAQRQYGHAQLLTLLNVVRCETHRELLNTVIEQRMYHRYGP